MPENNKLDQINLDKYLWKNRPVLIFAPSSKDISYLKQKSEFEGRADELQDRDIIVLELLKSGGSTITEVSITDEQQSILRKQFDVVGGFVFILIGKDGTVKLSSEQPVPSDELFGLIDKMPMRREEMRKKASKSRN